jgi:hypothetical protein
MRSILPSFYQPITQRTLVVKPQLTAKGETAMAIKPAPLERKFLSLHDFEIRPNLFKNKRTGEMESDMALFIDGELHESTYTWGKRAIEASKPLRFDTLLEIAKLYEDDVDESTASYILSKQFGFKDLSKTLEENRIKVPAFFKWVAENEDIKTVNTKVKEPGTRITSDAVILAGIVNKMADMSKEGDKPNLKMRVDALRELINNDTTVNGALEYLQEKLDDPNYGWDEETTKEVKIKGIMKSTKNPTFGQVRLKLRGKNTEE